MVRVGEARRETVTQVSRVTGQLRPARRSLVASEESGRVVLAPPDAGTAVKAGTILARIDDEIVRINRDGAIAQVAEAQAICEQREALLASATRERQRLATLLAERTAKRKELDDATDVETAARATVDQAKATLSGAQTDLARIEAALRKLTITAPFDGYVISKRTEVGQWLSPGDPVAEVLSSDQIDAMLDVPEYLVGHLRADQPVTVHIEGVSRIITAPVHRIVPDADPRARTFPVNVRLTNDDGVLMSGMTVTADLPNGKEAMALTVPRDAVQVTPAGMLVYVNRGGAAIPAYVRIRFGVGDRFVIDGPINPGEQVIVEGNERILFPGQPLMLMREPAEPGGAPTASNDGSSHTPPSSDTPQQ